MISEILSAVILLVFAGLTLIGAVSTMSRSARYRFLRLPQPVLLGRDRDLLLGLAIPFGIIATVRAFDLFHITTDSEGFPHLWYILVTGLPPIYAMGRYCYYELFIIEKPRRDAEKGTE